jgi:cell division protein FtsL
VAKRQKLLEIARQQAELEEIERNEKIKQAKKLAQQEKQQLRTEEAIVTYETQVYITKLMADGLAVEAEAKELRNQISTKANEQDRLEKKMQGWIKL